MFWNKFWGRPRFISFVICWKILTLNTMMIKDIFFSKTWWLIPNASGWTPAVTLRSMFNICATVCAGYPPSSIYPPSFNNPLPIFPRMCVLLHPRWMRRKIQPRCSFNEPREWISCSSCTEQTIQNSVEMWKATWIFFWNFWASNITFVEEFKFM